MAIHSFDLSILPGVTVMRLLRHSGKDSPRDLTEEDWRKFTSGPGMAPHH